MKPRRKRSIYILVPLYTSKSSTEVQRFIKYYDNAGLGEDADTWLRANYKRAVPVTGPTVDDIGSRPDDVAPHIPGKGRFILDSLRTIESNIGKLTNADVLLIDGSWAFDYRRLPDLAYPLKRGEKWVAALRRPPFGGIIQERQQVEAFENHLIGGHFGVELPDLQGGAWGFNGKFLSKLLPAITAEGYEIEADLGIAALKAGAQPHYIPMDVKPLDERIGTSNYLGSDEYTPTRDIDKLRFIMKKLGLSKKQVLDLQKAYSNDHKLPGVYIDAMRAM